MDAPPGFTPIAGNFITTSHCLKSFKGNISDHIDPRHQILQMQPERGCNKPGQKGAYVIGPFAAPPLVMRTCSCNAEHAAVKRHLAERHDPTPEMTRTMVDIAELIRPILEEHYYRYRASMSWENWMARWPAWKSKAIKNAILHEDINLPKLVTAMIKREVLVGFKLDHLMKELLLKEPDKARLIHFYRYLATQERHALRYYCFQKALSDVFCEGSTFQVPGCDIQITISSAMNQHAKGRWYDDVILWSVGGESPTARERDGGKWDSTMGDVHMDIQLRVMRNFEADFLETVEATRKCKVKFRATGPRRELLDFLEYLCYLLDCTTKSGHNDTSSRNSLINAIITIAAIIVNEIREARAIVIGDDMWSLFRERPNNEALDAAEYDCGIEPVSALFEPEAFARTEFASDAFAPSTEGTIAIPKFGKLAAKLFVTTTSVRPKDRADFAYSVALGLTDLLIEAPLYGDFLRCALQNASERRVIKTHKWQRETEKRVHYDDSFYDWLFARYAITRSEIAELQSFLRECDGPGYMKHPLLDKIMLVDLADPKDRV